MQVPTYIYTRTKLSVSDSLKTKKKQKLQMIRNKGRVDCVSNDFVFYYHYCLSKLGRLGTAGCRFLSSSTDN